MTGGSRTEPVRMNPAARAGRVAPTLGRDKYTVHQRADPSQERSACISGADSATPGPTTNQERRGAAATEGGAQRAGAGARLSFGAPRPADRRRRHPPRLLFRLRPAIIQLVTEWVLMRAPVTRAKI